MACRRRLFHAGVLRLWAARRLRRLSSVGRLQQTAGTWRRPPADEPRLDERAVRDLLGSDHAGRRVADGRLPLEPEAVRVDVATTGPDDVARPQRTAEGRTSENVVPECGGRQSVGHRSRRRRRRVQTQLVEEETSDEETERGTSQQVVTGLDISLFD